MRDHTSFVVSSVLLQVEGTPTSSGRQGELRNEICWPSRQIRPGRIFPWTTLQCKIQSTVLACQTPKIAVNNNCMLTAVKIDANAKRVIGLKYSSNTIPGAVLFLNHATWMMLPMMGCPA